MALLLAGVLAALALPRLPQAPYLLTLGGGLALAGAAGWSLTAAPVRLDLGAVAPFARLLLRLDGLAAFFLLGIAGLTAAVSVYALGYVDRRHYGEPVVGAAFCAFVAAMAGVVLADGVFSFLLCWELMSLASFLLVMHDHQQAAVRRAGFIYIAMTHAGAAFLVAAFLLLAAATGSLTFDGFRSPAPGLDDLTRNGAFLLFLVGFAAKAGAIPLHVWLPRAHPVAPSHVSALMSGVMVKTALYALLRVAADLLAPGPEGWGWLVLAMGAVSAVLGVLYALMERDLKRMLAYSTVENVGIVLLGIGGYLVLAARGMGGPAGLALAAALFHALNHTAFKGLLFLGAGAVQRAAGTRDMERLGGLIRTMPWTAGCFLVGAAAIAAIPPLNGFASEWLTMQALLQVLAGTENPVVLALGAAAVGALALTGGLAALCFVRAFGVPFLGVPRSPEAAHTTEAPLAMRTGMGLLAAACLLLGLQPEVVTRPARQVAATLLPQGSLAGAVTVPAGVYVPLGVAVALGLLAVLAAATVRLLWGAVGERVTAPWVCGVVLEPRMQYSGAALAKPIRLVFQRLLSPERLAERRYHQAPYFVAEIHYEGRLRAVYESALYRPVVALLVRASVQVRQLQSGSLRLYLAYIFATLVVVLVATR